MIDLSSDGRLLLETHGNGKGAVWDVDPESWKRRACDLANRTLTPRGVGGVPPGSALRAGLRDLSRAQARIDQVKRVRLAGGARPPGRRPRRTSSVGGVASRASRRRAAPSPSRCHLVDSPTTSVPASRLASSMPSSPGGVRSGSAEMPRTRWTASAPCESRRLASRLPCSGTAAAPASRSGTRVGAREPGAELDRGPVVLRPSERDEHRSLGRRVPRDEERHVAGRLLEQGRELLVGSAVVEELVRGLGEEEVDVELGREPSELLTRRRRRERGRAGDDPLRLESGAALLEPGRRRRKLGRVGHEPGEDDDPRWVARQLSSDREKRVDAGVRREGDENRPLRRPGGGRPRFEVERRVLPEDRPLQLLEGGAGLDPEPVDEGPARGL